MLPNAPILHGQIDNALFCRTLGFGSDPNILMFPRRRKNKKKKNWVILDAFFVTF